MKTNTLIRFIEKHHLGGLVNKALWRKCGDTLRVNVSKTSGFSRQPNFFASVKLKDVFGFENGDIGVGDLKGVLKTTCNFGRDSISLSLEKHPSGEVAALLASSKSSLFRHQCPCLDEFKTVPMTKPDCRWNAAIVLEDDIKKAFVKAHSVFGNSSHSLFTVVVSKRTGRLSVVFGYSGKWLRDSICLGVSCANGLNTINRPVAFNVVTLKQILKANSEFKDPILWVSEAGVASIEFSDNELDVCYLLKEIGVED